MADKVKVYIGCSITQAPPAFSEAVEDLKTRLRDRYEILEFLGLHKGTDKDVYNWDIHQCVKQCDLFVAICDHASLGLGYELGAAIEAFNKPVLAVAHQDARVTRLVTGIDSPLISFERYTDFSDIEKFIEAKLASTNSN